ncbi:MAG: putative nitroreductase [Nitrospira sp.]|jgi:SagB-type dehydrogenase family enzyme|nr:putative nitroreductase [Nitrospira sp.]
MSSELWQDTYLPPGNKDQLWELFHENSKIGRFSRGLSDQEVRLRMTKLHESLDFVGYPLIKLPPPDAHFKLSLSEAITSRTSCRHLNPERLSLGKIATLLHYAYGINRSNSAATFPRPFRVVPSGGALYPLELFFYSSCIEENPPGMYHYSPEQNQLRLLSTQEEMSRIERATAYPELIRKASIIIFITAIFERSIFKYGDRGYRFILLEAGHVAQNLNLVSNGLNLGSINIGGFFDHEIDDLLGLDGVTHSTIYIVAIGQRTKPTRSEPRA